MNIKKFFGLVCASVLVLVVLVLARHNLNRGAHLKPAATPDRYIKFIDFLPSPDGKNIAVRRRIEQTKKGNVVYELWLVSLGQERTPGLAKSRLIYSADTKNHLASRFLSWDTKSKTTLFYTWDRKTNVRTLWDFSVATLQKRQVLEFKQGLLMTALRASNGDVYAQFDDEIWNISSQPQRHWAMPRKKGDMTGELIGIVDDSVAYMIAADVFSTQKPQLIIFNLQNATILYSDEIYGSPVYVPSQKEWIFVRKLDKKTGRAEIVTLDRQHFSKAMRGGNGKYNVASIMLPPDLDSVPVISKDGSKIAGTYLSKGKLVLYHQAITGAARKTMTPPPGKSIKDPKLQWLTNNEILLVTSDSDSQETPPITAGRTLNIYNCTQGNLKSLPIS